ncbi:hypothetical protein P9K31_04330 [Corynebacterium glutamicum]|nr:MULTISPECIES: hypothetical protein [Corynebacterium]WFP72521.1 hypothetical protein P9K31_04330 [Corynebacterium glutamicum]
MPDHLQGFSASLRCTLVGEIYSTRDRLVIKHPKDCIEARLDV